MGVSQYVYYRYLFQNRILGAVWVVLRSLVGGAALVQAHTLGRFQSRDRHRIQTVVSFVVVLSVFWIIGKQG